MSKAHDYTRKTTLTVFFHTIFPFEIFECKTNLHKPKFSYKTKKHRVRKHDALFGAANQIRTGDLVLTKDVLYHLSHSSKSGRTIARPLWRPGTGSNRRPPA